jgi:hypothetical protein
MTQDDEWLEKLLRSAQAQPLADDGFTESLMIRLPSRHLESPNWIIAVSVLIGALLATTISSSQGLLWALHSLIGEHQVHTFQLMPLVLIWAAAAWALSESRGPED